MRKITKIIVHCTATPDGRHHTVSDVDLWHKQKGYGGIGYHYLIYLDGSVHSGRDELVSGVHCAGHNGNSIGICYVGGCASDGRSPKDTRTAAQKTALKKLVSDLRKKYPGVTVHGHREFAAKACPCFDAGKEFNYELRITN